MNIKTVLLEITDRCNLNCTHCMNRPDFKEIETPAEKIGELFEKFSQHNAEKVYLSGGEPFLHKEIEQIIDLCIQYPNMKFIFTTNGLLLSAPLLSHIAQADNVTIQFSIDGVTEPSYEAMRGKGTYNKFCEKIALWDQMTKKQGLARTCLTKYNYKDLPGIYVYCLQHRLLPSFLFTGFLGNGRTNWENLELNLAQKIWCIDQINKLNNRFGMNISTPEAPASCNFTENTGVGSLLIRADGTVTPCQYFYDASLGNVFEQEIDDIMNSPWIAEHCRIAQERKQILEKSHKCQNCKIKDACNYGCMGIANDLGNMMSYDGLCDLRVMTTVCYSNRIITANENAQKKNVVHISREESVYEE